MNPVQFKAQVQAQPAVKFGNDDDGADKPSSVDALLDSLLSKLPPELAEKADVEGLKDKAQKAAEGLKDKASAEDLKDKLPDGVPGLPDLGNLEELVGPALAQVEAGAEQLKTVLPEQAQDLVDQGLGLLKGLLGGAEAAEEASETTEDATDTVEEADSGEE